ncbi:MAG: tagaturonate reductase [Lachnospiraceae bacterium]|nr:tagaturonate reductase [Lachnospiraceae bacterium]
MKETIIQFGEGGFLRSFVDYFFDGLNKQGLYDGKVVVVQPIEQGMVSVLNEQNGEYHQFLRGIKDGKPVEEMTKIDVISRGLNPYEDYKAYLELAHNKDARVIVSNTTEAGIVYLGTEKLDDAPPKSFPAKLTALLYERFKAGLPGFIILSCELIDHNGDVLKECVLKYVKLWELGEDFENFVKNENHFCSTLVDRICTGYPRDDIEEFTAKIGKEDKLVNTAEIFHLWVIEGDFEDELPFRKAGFNVVWTNDVTPYKKRKVRILNGGHTSMVLAAHLYGLETVGECVKDEVVGKFLNKTLFEEIIPTLGNSDVDVQFGKDVVERFANPFVKHRLLSIALNSVSKFTARVLPTILEYYEQNKKLPECLTFSLAALLAFYKTDAANDLPEVMEFLKTATVAEALAKKDYWDADLSFMKDQVEAYYNAIQNDGIAKAYQMVL